MEDVSSRIRITEAQGRTVVFIKPHNSVLHAFFILLVESAIFMSLVFIFAMSAAVFKSGFIITVLAYSLAAVSRLYYAGFAFIVLRSLLWTMTGGEILEINTEELIYTKKIAGIKKRVIIKKADILGVAVIDYIREKDVIHMMQSEITTHGRSLLLKTAKKDLKFGIYISMDDSDTVEKVLKSSL